MYPTATSAMHSKWTFWSLVRTIFATCTNMTKLSILPTVSLCVSHNAYKTHNFPKLPWWVEFHIGDRFCPQRRRIHIFIHNFQQTWSSKAVPLLRRHVAGHSSRWPFKLGASPCRLCGKHSGTGSGFSSVSVTPPMLHVNPYLHNYP